LLRHGVCGNLEIHNKYKIKNMKKTTIGVFENRLKSEMIINELKASGIADNEISCVYTDKEGELYDSQTDEKMTNAGAKGAGVGAVVGALAGLVVANAIVPGLGTLVVAGTVLPALGIGISTAVATTAVGAAVGAVALGIVAALTQLGVSGDDAALYEEEVRAGKVLIVTRTDLNTAKDILNKNGASRVREYVN
jgi:hypothetical protein